MMFKTISLAAAAVIGLSIAAVPAIAGEIAGTVHTSNSVRYSDLDISRAPGAIALLSRITSAAHRVCGPAPDFRDLPSQVQFHGCVSDAVARAVASVNSVLVTDIFKNGPQAMSIAQRN